MSREKHKGFCPTYGGMSTMIPVRRGPIADITVDREAGARYIVLSPARGRTKSHENCCIQRLLHNRRGRRKESHLLYHAGLLDRRQRGLGLLTVGGPEVLAILAAVILGKENFDRIKATLFRDLKRFEPSARVGKARYTIGLVMFVLPILPTYVMGYVPQWLPDSSPMRLHVNVAADCMFVVSLFVLGGDFWEKLKALFVYEAKACLDTASDHA